MGMGPSGCHDRLRAWSRVVAAGCGFILDRNWGSKNSYLIDGVAHRGSLSRVMGLAGKPKEFAGAEVERYFREGKIKEVADYCETDVVLSDLKPAPALATASRMLRRSLVERASRSSRVTTSTSPASSLRIALANSGRSVRAPE